MSFAAHLHVPAHAVGDFGEDVAEFSAEILGRPLDPQQVEAVSATTSIDRRGRWAARETVVVEARQNGKTGGKLTPKCLWDLFTGPPDRIVWTAHLFITSREAFKDHKLLIEGSDWLSSKVLKVSESHGQESIELRSGARIDYLARSKGGGRGLGGKRVVIDEALIWTGTQAGALLPVLAARSLHGDPQIDYASSAAFAGPESDYLRTLVGRGRSGKDPSLVLVEHCAPGSWDDPGCLMGSECSHVAGVAVRCALDNESLWPHANPALGVRLDVQFLRDMRLSMPAREFGREFLGWHEAPAGEGTPPIDVDEFDALAEVGSEPDDRRVVFAVQVAANGRSACVAVAGRRGDGRWHLEIVEDRPGVEWVIDAALGLLERWPESLLVLMASGPSGQLVPELLQRDVKVGAPGREDGHRVELLTLQQHAQACGLLETYVRAGKVAHVRTASGDPDPRWRVALQGARTKASADAWVWSLKDSTVDPLHLIAATNALACAVRRSSGSVVDNVW